MNGQVATIGDSAELDRDTILVDGIPLKPVQSLTYLALNKPRGVTTTRSDPHALQTVMDLVRGCGANVFPVGRLDKDTEGLLLLTNDGDLAFRLTHPRFGVEKVYRAEVQGEVSEESLNQLRTGVQLEDGLTSPAGARLLNSSHKTSVLELSLHEGRKRQVRRMCLVIGHPVVGLERVRYGPLETGPLKPGHWRHLYEDEIRALQEATQPE